MSRESVGRATRILAPNPGPMTLDGTNTWLLLEPGGSVGVVVDPGPELEGHLRAVLSAAADLDARVGLVLLTHGHPDHAEGANRFAQLAGGVPVRALDPRHRLGAEGLGDSDVVEVGGLEIRVVGTPGHTSDSLSFVVPADRTVLTGDTVLGRGTTVVAHPDGRLVDYLASLRRLRDLAAAHEITTVLPGHGPVLTDALAAVDGYLAHRAERLAQVERAVTAGARTPREVVERVYADVDRAVWPAAELSVRAQLDYIDEVGNLPGG
ncbi:MAG TPA: MBL fold metallo-hydrolase [Actinomycetes bacterium]|nr:MBL fold metallo-hydrolase [Actinomycetes bacterium]